MLNFIFCIHNHQPVGNFDHVLEDAYVKAYEPFLKAVSGYPNVKIVLHTSGFLLDWLAKNHSSYVDLLKVMVERGQLEVMGGGYYEPVLAVIPSADRIGQITMLADRIEELFGVRPRGLWLAERVWDPSLPYDLNKAGIEYVVLDDYHFIKSGLKENELNGYYITEDRGALVRVFPGSERLRYLMPFEGTERLGEYLRETDKHSTSGELIVFADDGEKFGVWPGTDKWVYEDGWFDGFLKLVSEASEWLRPTTFSEYIDCHDPKGTVYLPTTSYMEMGEWSLPPDAALEYKRIREELKHWDEGEKIARFFQGGTWRNFLAKYPESNWMHKRMLSISRALEDSSLKAEALVKACRELYMSECNDAYWHGVFGGLYLPHLREASYKHILNAEQQLTLNPKAPDTALVRLTDINADTFDEVELRSQQLTLFVSPRAGGSIVELDAARECVNLTNTLSRWNEGYHMRLRDAVKEDSEDSNDDASRSIHERVVVKEEGLEDYLIFDDIKRTSLRERFFAKEETLGSFSSTDFTELGDFMNSPFLAEPSRVGVTLKREGVVRGHELQRSSISITKELALKGADSIQINYLICAKEAVSVRMGVEFNLLLPCCNGPACYMSSSLDPDEKHGLGEALELRDIDSVTFNDTHTRVGLEFKSSKRLTLWSHPIETVSLSEAGFERNYQGSCLLFILPLNLDDGGKLRFSLTINLLSGVWYEGRK
jgi:alpha-amylase